MCGIVGALGGDVPRVLAGGGAVSTAGSRSGRANSSLESLARRGPDGSGTWSDLDAGIWIGHTRLAIVDRSSAGAQPMRSASGRWIIAFNGEIYNHRELRARVETAGASRRSPADWRGHADTESLVEHIDAFGLDATLQAIEGMCAFAAWDSAERTLHLVRDPIGQKPLYWGWVGGRGAGSPSGGGVANPSLVFASQLCAIEAMPGFERRMNSDALAALMRWQCVPGGLCIYEGLNKLEPGHRLEVAASGPGACDAGRVRADLHASLTSRLRSRPWWSLGQVISEGVDERAAALRTSASRREAVAHASTAIREAVASQLEADVPLGVLLSGGVDSSLVLAVAQERLREMGAGQAHAFTIGFDDAAHDESAAAAAVAEAMGARHHMLRARAEDALEAIPSLSSIYDEPFADSSQLPTAIVARLARAHVGVALTGDGGDEMFGGYRRHWAAAHVWPVAARMPASIRSLLAGVLRWRYGADRAAGGGGGSQRLMRAQAAEKLAQVLRATSGLDAHWLLASSWRNEWPLRSAARPEAPDHCSDPWWGRLSHAERSIALDTLHYLPDDILVKVDRAAMHVGLETRAPLLDTRVVAAAWRLPLELRMGREGKHVLRTMLGEYLPPKLVSRPKHGFSAPIESWLRGPLRDWGESLLRPADLERDGLDAQIVRRSWDAVIAGQRDARDIWTVLMFRQWRERAIL